MGCRNKVKDPSQLNYLSIDGEWIVECILFKRVLALCEMQIVLSKIWTQVTMSISNYNNAYTTGTSTLNVIRKYYWQLLISTYKNYNAHERIHVIWITESETWQLDIENKSYIVQSQSRDDYWWHDL